MDKKHLPFVLGAVGAVIAAVLALMIVSPRKAESKGAAKIGPSDTKVLDRLHDKYDTYLKKSK